MDISLFDWFLHLPFNYTATTSKLDKQFQPVAHPRK